MKIHILKESITLRDDKGVLPEEYGNNLSSPRILIQDMEKAEEFFSKLIRKHIGGIIRPKVTLSLDKNIFDDGITNTEVRAISFVLFKADIRKLIYKDKGNIDIIIRRTNLQV